MDTSVRTSLPHPCPIIVFSILCNTSSVISAQESNHRILSYPSHRFLSPLYSGSYISCANPSCFPRPLHRASSSTQPRSAVLVRRPVKLSHESFVARMVVSKSKRKLAKVALLLLALLLLVAAILLLVFLIPHHRRTPLPPPKDGNNCSSTGGSANAAVAFDFSPFLLKYRSGCVHRMDGTARVPAGVDDATGVTSKDVVIDHATGLAARMYLPPPAAGKKQRDDLGGATLPVLVFYHGGAFVIMSPFEPKYHAYLNALVARARVVAVSVDYRLAPEHPLPAAYDDAWAALNWVVGRSADPWLRDRGNLSRLFLAGDSAGANIAHNMAMRAGVNGGLDGGSANITGVLLLDPYFWGKRPVGAETTDPATRRRYEETWSFICVGRYGIDDPRIDPLAAPPAELRRMGCSRVAVTVSGLDDFEARGKAYAAALNGSGWGGEVVQYETDGERHVYFLDNPASPKSAKELAFAAGFLSRS